MLHEEERPNTWGTFIGNQKAVAKAKAITDRAKQTGQAFALWIDGPSGTGKTTLAKIVAYALDCDPGFSLVELDGPACDGQAVKNLEDTLACRSFSGGYRVVIVNEAHAMTPKGAQLWLTLLERLPKKVAVIFTTTEGRKDDLFGNFDGPMKSRTIPLSLTNQGLAETFAKHAQKVAEKHGLGGASPKEYLALVRKHKNNMRAVLSEIEGFEMYRASVGAVAQTHTKERNNDGTI